jgi:hypothetical protein
MSSEPNSALLQFVAFCFQALNFLLLRPKVPFLDKTLKHFQNFFHTVNEGGIKSHTIRK